MSEVDKATLVVREWVEKAENDLTAAIHLLKMGKACPTDTVGFHAQQCVEKYLKAVLVSRGRGFPKIHDVLEILALLPPDARPTVSPEEARQLTNYATVTRYPGDYDPLSLAEARRAVATARRIRKEVRAVLPSNVLRRRSH